MFFLTAYMGNAKSQTPDVPKTDTKPVTDTLHGKSITDPYRWLEDGNSPETKAWTAEQNAYTAAYLKKFPQREALKAKLETLLSQGSVSAGGVFGNRIFFSRRDGKQNQPIVYYRDEMSNAKTHASKTALDPNTLSTDGTVALDWYYPSHDGSLIAYGTSPNGNEISTLRIRDLETGKDLSDEIPYTRAASVAWLKDKSGFYYSHLPKPETVAKGDEGYYRKIYFHKIGTDPAKDELVFKKELPKEYWQSVQLSENERYLIVSVGETFSRTAIYVKDLKAKTSDFVLLTHNKDASFHGDVVGNTLYLQTSYNASRNRIIAIDLTTDLKKPDEKNWKTIVPEQDATLEGFNIIDGKLVVNFLQDASTRLKIFSLDGKFEKDIPLPTLGTASGVAGEQSGTMGLFSFSSYFFPPIIYKVDMKSGTLEVFEQITPTFDLTAYETKQFFYVSKDGMKIPMFIVSKKGVKQDGTNPTWLYGYGGFEVSLTPSFNSLLPVWLDAGGVYVVANLRGGGEYGDAWHKAGMLEKKQNVFDDMIAAAEYLVNEKYTSPQKLVTSGGSNGGLLMGAMLVQRPDLFKAIVCEVPLLDMIRYHKFLIARLWIPEYGSADDEKQFEFISKYSPYHNVKDVAYPATLFMTAESDTRVDPLHARKMAALVQAKTKSQNPILVRIESNAGHGAGKPVSKIAEAATDRFSFLMMQLGIEPKL
jgi:prolyl oligopeptidase